MKPHTNCKPGCRYVGMAKHPAECEPRGTVGALPPSLPDACWFCSRPLGSHPDCLMCDAYRKDNAPPPSPALQSAEPLTEDT